MDEMFTYLLSYTELRELECLVKLLTYEQSRSGEY
jgi:hypothetical protein